MNDIALAGDSAVGGTGMGSRSHFVMTALVVVLFLGCDGEGESTPYPGCPCDTTLPVPETNVMLVNTGTTDFIYTSTLCKYILSEDWDDNRPVRMIGTVTRVLDRDEAWLVKERVCDPDAWSCWYRTVLDLTVEHDFDGKRHPGERFYLLVVGPEIDECRRVYEGNRLMFFGKLLSGKEPFVAIACSPAMFTIRNCHVFAPDSFAITAQFGDAPVTEAEMASLVEETLRIGAEACNEPSGRLPFP
jgi:hypothetical protein